MRSPVVAFSLFAAAVSASASIPNSPDHDSGALSPKLDAVGFDDSGLKDYMYRRDTGTGLGISKSRASAPAHYKRASPARQHSDPAELEIRPEEPRISERPHPEPPVPGGATGCNPDTVSEESAVVATAADTRNENGGVSCSSSAQGASADSTTQDGSGNAKSPSAGPASGSTIFDPGLDGLFNQGQGGGASGSGSVTGNNAEPIQDTSVVHGTYPGYGTTRTTPQVPRGLSALTHEDAQNNLFEVVNGTTAVAAARSLPRTLSPDGAILDDVDPGVTGAPGESIYGDAIPGSGPQGGGADPGIPGPSDGGRVIESGNVVDSGSDTPGVGGHSRSGTARGGNGRS
ncbi:hypothetical protein DAEQUDRAFT_807113 [Daedalea quercina L-15889]|uniref:Uncharacterized protein n=1 Tax=Daedalea quercina L-15889 TaxID=1314783 RepID=A0A165UEK0_9APHY|nr:hypothetical protein DAEQUDRAFT_807113 [Daedalea quercina L-15889]